MKIALDLSEVPFMDSSSLGVMVGGLKRARERGGDLTLMSLQASPAKVMALTGLDGVFPWSTTPQISPRHDPGGRTLHPESRAEIEIPP